MNVAMPSPGDMSLRARLLLCLLALCAVAALAVGGVTYRNVLAETEALFDYQLRQMALSLRDQGEVGAGPGRAPGDASSTSWCRSGAPTAASSMPRAPGTMLPPRALLGFAEVQRAASAAGASSAWPHAARVIQVGQPRAGAAPARRCRSLAQRAAAAADLRRCVALAHVVAGGAVAARRCSARGRRANAAHAESLRPLPAAGLPERSCAAGDGIERAAGAAARRLDAQRAFVADAAHELRSPLTALKLQLDVLRARATVPPSATQRRPRWPPA